VPSGARGATCQKFRLQRLEPRHLTLRGGLCLLELLHRAFPLLGAKRQEAGQAVPR